MNTVRLVLEMPGAASPVSRPGINSALLPQVRRSTRRAKM